MALLTTKTNHLIVTCNFLGLHQSTIKCGCVIMFSLIHFANTASESDDMIVPTPGSLLTIICDRISFISTNTKYRLRNKIKLCFTFCGQLRTLITQTAKSVIVDVDVGDRKAVKVKSSQHLPYCTANPTRCRLLSFSHQTVSTTLAVKSSHICMFTNNTQERQSSVLNMYTHSSTLNTHTQTRLQLYIKSSYLTKASFHLRVAANFPRLVP